MAQNGYGAAPVAGHIGRIPNYGRTQVNPLGSHEPPACIQNAMMTKDKKPFTYTPGGLDLSQIRTPSMARRLARQRSWEEQEQPQYAQQPSNGGYHSQGGPVPPPPPPPKMPVPPPPPPPIVIQVPESKSPKPIIPGERPEIVIPENPIGMLRKTNSPYHWEAEKAELQKLGQTPKYIEKVPSPLTVKMPPSSFTQQQPLNYTPQNNFTRSYSNQNQPESPIYRPEAHYANQKTSSPQGSPPTRELLQRQDSQFNKSPQPYAGQIPTLSGSPYSPSPNNNWRQPEKRDSPSSVNSPQSPQYNRGNYSPNTQQYSNQQYSPNNQKFSPNKTQYSPNIHNQSPLANSSPAFHTLPRVGSSQNNNVSYNNTKPSPPTEANSAPWRTATLNRHPKEQENQQALYNNVSSNQELAYVPPWKVNQTNNSVVNNENGYVPPLKQENKAQQQYTPPWVSQNSNNNRVQENNSTPWRHQEQPFSQSKPNLTQEQPRYQSTMSIPVTPRKQNSHPEYNIPQKEVVYVNEEPVYYCPESPKSIPPWVKTQKEKTKTPPPAWVQRPLESRKSQSRELTTPPRDANQEPEWIKKSNEMQRGVREVISPPKYQQPVQPAWSTRPSENRKSLPRDNGPGSPGTRVIPIQMEVSTTETRDNRHVGQQNHPQLRITIGMNQNPNAQDGRTPFSPPTQRIMRVLSPQLVRIDDPNPQTDLPTLNRSFQEQPKTRIIPIQIEGGNGGANKSVYIHKFAQEGPPRQSKAFRVLQIITGTEDSDNIQLMEKHHGFTHL